MTGQVSGEMEDPMMHMTSMMEDLSHRLEAFGGSLHEKLDNVIASVEGLQSGDNSVRAVKHSVGHLLKKFDKSEKDRAERSDTRKAAEKKSTKRSTGSIATVAPERKRSSSRRGTMGSIATVVDAQERSPAQSPNHPAKLLAAKAAAESSEMQQLADTTLSRGSEEWQDAFDAVPFEREDAGPLPRAVKLPLADTLCKQQQSAARNKILDAEIAAICNDGDDDDDAEDLCLAVVDDTPVSKAALENGAVIVEVPEMHTSSMTANVGKNFPTESSGDEELHNSKRGGAGMYGSVNRMRSTESGYGHGGQSDYTDDQIDTTTFNRLKVPTRFRPPAAQTKEFNNYVNDDLHALATRLEFMTLGLVVADGVLMYLNMVEVEPKNVLRNLSLSFSYVFAAELLIRCCLMRRKFWNPWNICDSFIVLAGLVDAFSSGKSGVTALRMVRTVRLLKAFRLFQKMRFFQELRRMMDAMISMLRAIFWLAIGISLTLYIFMILLTVVHSEKCKLHPLEQVLLCEKFSTPEQTIVTLIQIMFNGVNWGEIYDLMDDPEGQLMLVAFVVLNALLIVNLSIGILTHCVMVSEEHELIKIGDQAHIRKRDQAKELTRFLQASDIDHNGTVTFAEFMLAARDGPLSSCLSAMGLELQDGREIFELLDRENKGAVDVEDFVYGLLRMRNTARYTDVMKLQLQNEFIGAFLQRFQALFADSQIDMEMDCLDVQGYGLRSQRSMQAEPRIRVAPEGRIELVEERALLLEELEVLIEQMDSECSRAKWKSHTGSPLDANKLDLYSLMYHSINPLTVPDGVELVGLDPGQYNIGDRVKQVDPYSVLPRAEGIIQSTVGPDGGIEIDVLKGRFAAPDSEDTSAYLVCINDVPCGTPTKVNSPNAVSYKEMISNMPQRPQWFCSHWWGEPVADFYKCCSEHSSLRCLVGTQASYWVCAYANCQHSIINDMGSDPENSSFRRAMTSAKGVLLILDRKATPFKRIWCSFEIYHTVLDERIPLDIVTLYDGEPRLLLQEISNDPPHETVPVKLHREGYFPVSLLAAGCQVKLEEGEASVAADKKSILDVMRKTARGAETVDSRLQGRFARVAWPLALQKDLVNDFRGDGRGTLRLPEVLKADTTRKKMEMSFTAINNVKDRDVEDVARGLPKFVECVSLDFGSCERITDKAIDLLSRAIGQLDRLSELELKFIGCHRLTNASLEWLAERLPHNLKVLELHFAMCPKIDNVGVHALARRLPRGLVKFTATFRGSKLDRNFTSVTELQVWSRLSGLLTSAPGLSGLVWRAP